MKQSKDKIGIGIIYLDPKYPTEFYKSQTDTMPFDSILFESNRFFNKGSYTIKGLTKLFKPYEIYAGDSDNQAEKNINSGLIKFRPKIAFKVLEKENNLFKVLINESKGYYSYIRVDKKINLSKTEYLKNQNFDPNFVPDTIHNWFFYESWQSHLNSSIISKENLKFYNEPKGAIKPFKDDFFIIDTLIGDWAKCVSDRDEIYWAEWKGKDSILFKFNRFLYY